MGITQAADPITGDFEGESVDLGVAGRTDVYAFICANALGTPTAVFVTHSTSNDLATWVPATSTPAVSFVAPSNTVYTQLLGGLRRYVRCTGTAAEGSDVRFSCGYFSANPA